jgi:hypothetical protein
LAHVGTAGSGGGGAARAEGRMSRAALFLPLAGVVAALLILAALRFSTP